MKNLIEFLFKKIVLIIFIFALSLAHGQTTTVTINFNNSSLQAGDTINVPVVFNSTANIGTWQIVLYYNRDVLTCISNGNNLIYDPVWSGFTPGVNNPFSLPSNSPQYPNQLATKVSWTTTGTYVACSNRTAFTLRFIYNGGSDTLRVINKITTTTGTPSYNSLIKNPTSNNINTTWINGYAGGATVPITSFSGGTSWKSGLSWDKGHVPNTSNSEIIIASNIATPMVLDTNFTTNLNVTINAGSALTINSGNTLTVNGNFLVKSNISGTGSLIQNGILTATNTKVQKYIYGNEWHIISIPVTSETASVFDASVNDGDSIYVKYLVNNNWTWIYSVNTPLQPNQGYFLWADTTYFHTPSPTLNFTGTINGGSQNITTIGGNNWQMIGNSYTSAIDWSTVSSRTNAAGSAYYSWNPVTGTYATSDGTVSTNGATQYIPAMQGFFIKSLNTNGISLSSSNTVHNIQAFFKSSNDINNLIRLTTSIGSRMDEAVIIYDQNATNNYDVAYDVPKLLANDSVVPEIYTLAGTDEIVINRFGTYPCVIPFNINLLKTVGNNNITITASDFSNFDANVSILLEDILADTIQDLRINSTYTFTASLGNNSGRFLLHFANPTGINKLNIGNVNIYSNEKNIYINTSENVKEISVYNILGQEIIKRTGSINQSLYKISVDDATSNYIVKVLTDKGVYTEKVFIK